MIEIPISNRGIRAIQNFLRLFCQHKWIDSSANKWYKGARINAPSTNNTLKSFNNVIKSIIFVSANCINAD